MWTTVSTRSGANPASAKRSRKGQLCSFQNGSVRFLPLPTHGSTTTTRPPTSTTKACTRITIRPRASANSGTTQGCRSTPSSLASGKKNRVGMPAFWLSTTQVIVASPTR